MKKTLLLLLIIVPTICFSDPGACYCVRADIVNLNGNIQTAYFKFLGQLYIENRNGQQSYATTLGWIKLPLISRDEFDFELEYQSDLSKYVLSLIGDTLKYSSDIFKIRYRMKNKIQEVGLLGEKFSIPKSHIKSFKLTKLMSCGIGTSILTELEISDKKWAKSVTSAESIGGFSSCDFTAIHFTPNVEDVSELIYKLKLAIKKYDESYNNSLQYSNEDREIFWKDITDKVKLLKEKKIIVLMSCIS